MKHTRRQAIKNTGKGILALLAGWLVVKPKKEYYYANSKAAVYHYDRDEGYTWTIYDEPPHDKIHRSVLNLSEPYRPTLKPYKGYYYVNAETGQPIDGRDIVREGNT